MKNVSLFRILAIPLVLCLVIIALPGRPALAASEEIEVSPVKGEIGERVEVSGNNFKEPVKKTSSRGGVFFEPQYVSIYFSADEAGKGDEIDDEVKAYKLIGSGARYTSDQFFATFDIPEKLDDGEDIVRVREGRNYYIYVTYKDDEDIVAAAEFRVRDTGIELDPDKGNVGEEIEITGLDFSNFEDILVEYDEEQKMTIVNGDEETDENGDFTCTVIIPESYAGEHTITVNDGGGVVAEATFTVRPVLTFSPAEASPGAAVRLIGAGFGEEVTVAVEFGGDELATETTDASGSFTLNFTVPLQMAGSYYTAATDAEDNDAVAEFIIAAGLELSETQGSVGDVFTVTGIGFAPYSGVAITFLSYQTTAATDAIGQFSAEITVPSGESGTREVVVSDGYSTVTGLYTVETFEPAIPLTVFPRDGDRLEAGACFDWEDVTDPSLPVTYILRIATDPVFTSVVLEKTGLAVSEYTLTEGELLTFANQSVPYYWRVRAVDGAGNMSSWTAGEAFTVNFNTDDIPGWPLYLLIGIGGSLIILVIWLLVMRSRQK